LGSQIELVALALGCSAGDGLFGLRVAHEKIVFVCAGDVGYILGVAEAVGDLECSVVAQRTRSLLGQEKWDEYIRCEQALENSTHAVESNSMKS